MTRFSVLLSVLASLLVPVIVTAETPPEQEAAIKALSGIASNLQKNRDGTVRFVRFSRSTVTDEHLEHVAAFQQLDYLAVVTPTVTDAGLKHVAGLTNLDTLFLSDSGLTDVAMPALADLKKLQRLYLDRTAVTDDGLQHLAGLTELTTLSLDGTAITDDGLQHLTGLTTLETLSLNGTRISDAGLKHLAGLTQLRSLALDGNSITGTALAGLKELKELSHLSLRGTHVTADSLLVLKGHPKLTQLLLTGTQLTAADVAPLRATNTKLNVVLNPTPDRQRSAFERLLAGETLRIQPDGVAGAGARHERSPGSTQPDNAGASLAGSVQPKPPRGADSDATEAFVADDSTPDFQKHVLPLFGRLGCNGRTCHGSFQGKGGFSLSMFGYDFAADLEALTGGDEPRVNKVEPEKSLILNKPTSDENHGGGQRFERGGWEYHLLRRWIAAGAKGVDGSPRKLIRFEVSPREIQFKAAGETVRLRCVAEWEDGSVEDVTRLTRFQSNDDAVAEVSTDGVVTNAGTGDTHIVAFYDNGIFAAPVLRPVSDRIGEKYPTLDRPTEIDGFVIDKLAKLGIVPSDVCSDTEFLRRVSLDMIGTLPTADEVTTFVADPSPDKRARKIDELLQTPAYTEWWTMRLSDLTGCNSQYLGTTDMNSPAAGQWTAWLRRRVQDNVGWDRIAAGIILAESRRPGQSYADYASEQSRHLSRVEPTDFTALDNPMHYYWFRSNNQLPVDRTLSFGYVFLGVRLQCAQCHKHPFDEWSKQDFEQFTEFFTRIKSGVAPDAKPAQDQLKTKLGVPVKLDTAALRRQMYLRVSAEGLPIPWNEIYIEQPGDEPQIARLLGGDELNLNDFADPREPLMAWLLQKDNPYFAPSFVNRIWHHYFGVGIVEPPDDFNRANPPRNRPLLDWLSREFIARGYDMKWLHRTIANSQTYQRSIEPNATNGTDERNFSRSLVRRLPAEVTIDVILQATANDKAASQWSDSVGVRRIAQHPRSIQAQGIDYSLLVFGKPLRTTNCDCERQAQPTLLQSLYVRNDEEVLGWIDRKDGWLTQVTAGNASSDDAVTDDLDMLIRKAWLRTQSHEPDAAEIERAKQYLETAENTVDGLRDLLWALINSQEFLTNH
ncbi:DUF1553 domain-containing protein [bacterium]|nr:DUF1553 domain-containing protein [bacterium]